MRQKILALRQRPEVMLMCLAAAIPFSFATWQALLNNFAIERAAFTGADMGLLQGIREIPGLLAFAVVLLLLLVREQRLFYWMVVLMAAGTAVTGFFPSVLGLYLTTVLMSLGFHYQETLQSSLSLQWLPKNNAPEILGRIISTRSFAAILSFAMVWLLSEKLALEYHWIYLAGAGISLLIVLGTAAFFPHFQAHIVQNKKLIVRRRYWLYYALTFMAGARRQIFVVFAGFLMVEKFGLSVGTISLLFLLNATLNIFLAPKIGRMIVRWGERRALICEYIGLIIVFYAYAVVETAWLAMILYVLDHLFFAMAISIKTYFQKIADPADIASTAGVAFSINHIAAVILPVLLGVVWMISPAAVFFTGTGIAVISLLLAFNIPTQPMPGQEVVFGRRIAGAVSTAKA
ncbi:MAG TPA: MFS transporter [Gammaproteobacteria bacterium]|nr:MFS transporter [Gammaproteobacteria bacterium]